MSNARGHETPDGTDVSVSRATIFDAFGNSIRDIPAVANTTARAQLVTDLTTASETPSDTAPLYVYRADAPGLHRIEYTEDGTVWIPASGLPRFVNDAARDSWTTSNSGLLSVGDRCFVGTNDFEWSGSAWRPLRWTAYTPAAFSATLGGGGAAVFRQRFVGGDLEIDGDITFGSSTSISGSSGFTFEMPTGITLASGYKSFAKLGIGGTNSDGAGTDQSLISVARNGTSTNELVLLAQNTAGTYAKDAYLSLFIPFTFQIGGSISFSARMRVA